MQSTTICTDPCRNSHAAGIPTEKHDKQSNDAMGLRTVPLKTTDTVQFNVLQLTRADRGCMHIAHNMQATSLHTYLQTCLQFVYIMVHI